MISIASPGGGGERRGGDAEMSSTLRVREVSGGWVEDDMARQYV